MTQKSDTGSIFPDLGDMHPGFMGFHAIDEQGNVRKLASKADRTRIHRVLDRNNPGDPEIAHITLFAAPDGRPAVYESYDAAQAVWKNLLAPGRDWGCIHDPRFVEPALSDQIRQRVTEWKPAMEVELAAAKTKIYQLVTVAGG